MNHSTMQPFHILGKNLVMEECVFLCVMNRYRLRYEHDVHNSVEAGSAVGTRFNDQEVSVAVSDRGCELEQSV